ncbi:rhomboid family intramembrane serine protease [Pseudonocardia acaciae]|uniref:rhomboid family intramembrane serine protease n=1 Tax=Pseudonocardia acaciae TaxID=551276 RepID=UPI000686CDEA|nr:rhomboid family intramembrane serine protease [Pseudonocardia acaciae]
MVDDCSKWAGGVARRYPVTLAVAVLTSAVSVPALVSPGLVRALEQDPHAFAQGQWWRLLTPMLIQGYGLGHLAFNLLGIVLAGIAVERRYGWRRWLVAYLAGGVVAIAVTSVLFPDQTDSGSSAGVAGLIGAMMVAVASSTRLPPWPSLLYGLFFAAYLSALALGGPIAGAVAGTAMIPAFRLTRKLAGEHALRVGILVVVGAATVAMLAVGDSHGIGLATGMIVATLPPPRNQ